MILDYLPLCVLSLMSGFSGWDGDWEPSFFPFIFIWIEWSERRMGLAWRVNHWKEPLCELMKKLSESSVFRVDAII